MSASYINFIVVKFISIIWYLIIRLVQQHQLLYPKKTGKIYRTNYAEDYNNIDIGNYSGIRMHPNVFIQTNQNADSFVLSTQNKGEQKL